MLCVDSAYQPAMDNLQMILGGEKFSVDTTEKVNGQMGRDALAYLWEAAGLFEKDKDRRRAFTPGAIATYLARGEPRSHQGTPPPGDDA